MASALNGLLGLFLGRRQRAAESNKTDAETAKTQAEARQIDSSIILKTFDRLEQFENITRQQRLQLTELEQQLMTVEFELEGERAKTKRLVGELQLLNLQIQRARAAGFLAGDHLPGTPNPAAGAQS